MRYGRMTLIGSIRNGLLCIIGDRCVCIRHVIMTVIGAIINSLLYSVVDR